jgi:hypothetical protein
MEMDSACATSSFLVQICEDQAECLYYASDDDLASDLAAAFLAPHGITIGRVRTAVSSRKSACTVVLLCVTSCVLRSLFSSTPANFSR